MWFTDYYIDYAKKFIDHTYDQRKVVLSDPKLTKFQIEGIKNSTVAYCTGYVVALRNFNILSESAENLLLDYISKRKDEV
jgi:hypothetical protein